MITPATEIRKLRPADLNHLAEILQESNSWKKLMSIVTKEDSENEPLFNSDHVRRIEHGSLVLKRSASEVFLEEWSTLGKKRPTCRSLLDYLVKAELFRAADYLAVEVMKVEPPERPKFGPVAKIDINLEDLLRQQAMINDMPRQSQPETWSLNAPESTAECEDRPKPGQSSEIKSDLMKFSEDNLVGGDDTIQSDLMKFSVSSVVNENNDGNFELEVAKSQDIPRVVMFKGQSRSEVDQSTTDYNTSEVNTSTSTRNSESDCTADASQQITNDSQPDYYYNPEDVPIPVVVLQMNARARQESASSS